MILGVGTDERELRKYALAIQQLSSGRSNAVIEVTLTPNATSTTVDFDNCSVDSAVLPCPMTLNAAAEIGNGTLRFSTIANRSFTVAHANNAQADRTFRFVCIG